MKVLIVCFDGLEYTLVERGDFPYLKQAEYGKYAVNVEPLFTPIIWASFITGNPKEKHRISGMMRWDNSFLERFNRSIGTFGARVLNNKRVVKTANLFGFHRRRYNKNDYTLPTIFDYANKPIAIGVPAYNQGLEYDEIDWLLIKSLDNPTLRRNIEEMAWKVFYKKREKTLNLLKSDWDLFMVHFMVTDTIQHILWFREEKIAKLYIEMDKTAKMIEEKVNEHDCQILIASDHGQLRGDHTPYGFYSSNKPLELKNPKTTDFANIIRKSLGYPDERDIKRVRDRLIALGYIS